MKRDLVSVVIPTYGGSEYLKRAVDSVLSQTYKSIEVIVVDDNGLETENQRLTRSVMAEYAEDTRVKYVCHEVNINGSAARNTGVRAAEGEYIGLLDDDDAYNPEKIEKQLEVLKGLGEEYALTYCSTEKIVNGKPEVIYHVWEDGELLERILRAKVTINTPSLLIRRTAYEHIGGFDESFRRHQDWEFLARMASEFKFKSVDYVGFRRYLTQRNSARDAETAKKYREHYLEKMMPYIKKLDKKTQKDIIIRNRLIIAFEFYKYKGFKAFWKEYCAAKPGFRGIRFMFRKFFVSTKRMAKGEKLRR